VAGTLPICFTPFRLELRPVFSFIPCRCGRFLFFFARKPSNFHVLSIFFPSAHRDNVPSSFVDFSKLTSERQYQRSLIFPSRLARTLTGHSVSPISGLKGSYLAEVHRPSHLCKQELLPSPQILPLRRLSLLFRFLKFLGLLHFLLYLGEVDYPQDLISFNSFPTSSKPHNIIRDDPNPIN